MVRASRFMLASGPCASNYSVITLGLVGQRIRTPRVSSQAVATADSLNLSNGWLFQLFDAGRDPHLVIFPLVAIAARHHGRKGSSGATEFSHLLKGGRGKLCFGGALRGCTSGHCASFNSIQTCAFPILKGRLMQLRQEYLYFVDA